jgi:BASS family bile acid:Na+ symporter
MSLITRAFPLLALLAAALGVLAPGLFDTLGNLIVPLLTLIMFAMGLTLTLDNFRQVFNQPFRIAVGTLMQFLIMPLAAFLIGHLLLADRELIIGLVLVGCCPGGTASNVICYLGRGNVALSIALTMVSTFLSVLATPFLTWLYLGQAIDVPVGDMMLSILQIVMLPVLVGMLINTFMGDKLKGLAPVLPVVSVLAIVMIIGIVVALNEDNLPVMGVGVAIAVILHNGVGIAGAYGLCKWLRYDEATCRTIAVEVGMQNSGLGVALASQFFSPAASLPGAVFSLWHNLSGSLLAGYWSKR